MKTIILAGGLGTRISEETENKPKPMVLIDDKPLIWHVMNIYASQGYDDFVIAAGYKANVINNWIENLESPWKIVSFDTGLDTMTGGRIKKCIESFPEERYFVTYGDGVGNVNLKLLLEFHMKNALLATVTAVRPPARFGVLDIEDGVVKHFGEKNQTDSGWINGGFLLLRIEYRITLKAIMICLKLGLYRNLQTLNNCQHFSIMVFGSLWIRFERKTNCKN